MDNCSVSKGTCWKWNSEKKRVSSRTAVGPRRAPMTQVASRADTVEMSRTDSTDKATRKAGASSSSWSTARSAEVSITNQVALGSVAEYLVVGAGVEHRQRRDAASKLLHSLHFIVDAMARVMAAEFCAEGI